MKTKTALKIAGGVLTILALAAPFISDAIESKLNEDDLDEKIDKAVKKAIKDHEEGTVPDEEEIEKEEAQKKQNKEIAAHLRKASIALVVVGFLASKLGDIVDDKLLDIRIDSHIDQARLSQTTVFNL